MQCSKLIVPLLGIAGLLLFATLTSGHNWGDDFAAYIMQAQSVVEGDSRHYIEVNRFTIEQSSCFLGPVCYPWGFPVMLAPLYAVFGLNMIALKVIGVISFLLFLLLLWIGFRKCHSPCRRICFVCLFALNPYLTSFSDNVLSDFPFLLVSTFSILLIGRIIVERRYRLSGVWDNILLGSSIAAAFFIRTNGILLLVTLGLTQLVAFIQMGKSKKKQDLWTNTLYHKQSFFSIKFFRISNFDERLFTIIVPYISFFGALVVWTMILPRGGVTNSSLLEGISLSIILQNLKYYCFLIAELFKGVPCHYLLYWISVVFCIVGLMRRLKKDYHLAAYLLLTFLLYIVFPGCQGPRYLFPLLPMYCSFAFTGMTVFQDAVTIVKQPLKKIIFFLPLFFVIAFFGMHSASNAYHNILNKRESAHGPFTEASHRMFEFIKRDTEVKSVVVFFKPRAMRMMTGRQSVMISEINNLSRGDYVCLHRAMGTDNQVSSDAVEGKGKFALIYENSEFKVYRSIKKEGSDNSQ
jgi:hypothetical protein